MSNKMVTSFVIKLFESMKLFKSKNPEKTPRKKELKRLLEQCKQANTVLKSLATGESMPLSSMERLILHDALLHEYYKGKVQKPATPAITRQAYRNIKDKLTLAEQKYEERLRRQSEKEKPVLVDPKSISLDEVSEINKKKVH